MSTPRDALALHAAGRTADALVLLFNAIGAAPVASPAVAEHRRTLASLLEGVALTSGNAAVFHGLLEVVRDPTVDAQSVARAVLGLLAVHGAFQRIEQEAATNAPATMMAIQALLTEPLVRETLRRIIVTDARAERVFTFVRQTLAGASWTEPYEAWCRDAMFTIATTANHGEYAWAETPDEVARVEHAMSVCSSWLESDDVASRASTMAPLLLRLAMYRPLAAMTNAERLLDLPGETWGETWGEAWPEILNPLFDAQLREPRAQRALASSLPALSAPSTDLTTDTSARVREMYEAHPYPRWQTVAQAQRTDIPTFVRALAGRTRVPNTKRVLIAGCGTGRQAAHTAISFRDADILALDLSLTSLGYAARRAHALGLANLSFVHGDLLHLDTVAEQFALIFCSGVLHHLADPFAGWEQLVHRLHPHGVMKVALYSTIARRPVAEARSLIASQRFAANDEGIRECRRFLLALPPTHPARAVTESADFFAVSGVRDLLMHVQERTYTLAQIAADLDRLNLRFLDFQLPAPVRAAFTAANPHPDAVRDLEAWARFEEQHPSTFWGMYQFFVEHRSR